DRQHGVDKAVDAELEATVALGHEMMKDAGLANSLPDRIDGSAQFFAFARMRRDERLQRGRAPHQLFRGERLELFTRKPVAACRDPAIRVSFCFLFARLAGYFHGVLLSARVD